MTKAEKYGAELYRALCDRRPLAPLIETDLSLTLDDAYAISLEFLAHRLKNGEPLSDGLGSAVQGDPAQAVAWLANTLGEYGVTLDAGDIILSGSLVPLAPAMKGDVFEMILRDRKPDSGGSPIGSCVARLV